MELTVEMSFCAALRLPNLEGPCQNLHGHDFRLAVTVAGRPDPRTGAIVDFLALKRIVEEEVVRPVDHRLLNEVHPNPTVENLATWIWGRLRERVPALVEIRIWESAELSVTYRGD